LEGNALRWLLVLTASFFCLFAVLVGRTNAQSHAVTYHAALSPQGDVLVTFTPDGSGVMRAELRDGLFTVVNPVTMEELTTRFSKHVYFDPPSPVINGAFTVTIPDELSGMARDSVRIEGSLDNGQLTGSAVLVICVFPGPCFDAASETWTEARVLDTPPAANDTVHVGRIEGQGPARVTATLNGAGLLTSLSLQNVVASNCFDPPRPFNVRLWFDPPLLPGTTVSQLIAPAFVPLVASFNADSSGVSGDISISNYIFDPVCSDHIVWSEPVRAVPTKAAPPAPTPTAVRPFLPAAGTGGPSSFATGRLLPALLALVGVASLGLARLRHA
jgi:hypothetical protein